MYYYYSVTLDYSMRKVLESEETLVSAICYFLYSCTLLSCICIISSTTTVTTSTTTVATSTTAAAATTKHY